MWEETFGFKEQLHKKLWKMQKLSCSPSLLFTSNGENHLYSEETISEMKLETVDEVPTKSLEIKMSDAFHSSHHWPPSPPSPPRGRQTQQAGLQPEWGPDHTSGNGAESLCRTLTNLPSAMKLHIYIKQKAVTASWPCEASRLHLMLLLRRSCLTRSTGSPVDRRPYRDANRLTW